MPVPSVSVRCSDNEGGFPRAPTGGRPVVRPRPSRVGPCVDVARGRACITPVRFRSRASVRRRTAPRHRHRCAGGDRRARACEWDRGLRGVRSRRRKDDRDRDAVGVFRDPAPSRLDFGQARCGGQGGLCRRNRGDGVVRLLRTSRVREPAGVCRSAPVPPSTSGADVRRSRRACDVGIGVDGESSRRAVAGRGNAGGCRAAGGECWRFTRRSARTDGGFPGNARRSEAGACRGSGRRAREPCGDEAGRGAGRWCARARPHRRRRGGVDAVEHPGSDVVARPHAGLACATGRPASGAFPARDAGDDSGAVPSKRVGRPTRSRRGFTGRVASLDRRDRCGARRAGRRSAAAGAPAGPQATSSYHRRRYVVRAGADTWRISRRRFSSRPRGPTRVDRGTWDTWWASRCPRTSSRGTTG